MIYVAKPFIGEKEKKAVLDVLNSGMLAQGPKVKEFEEKFAEMCGAKNAVAVNSGTAALHSALYAIGVGKGDEVITVPFTFVATVNPIIMLGAKPVFVDVDETTFNIDVNKIEEKINDKTKAIVAVDLYGQPANYQVLKNLAEKHNLKIVEDACQAHFAEFKGKKSGVLGDIGCFSFYATKNMMTGEGGMIVTNNDEYAELCKRFRHHGQSEQTRYQYFDLGYNYRMMDIQAAIGLVQLERLEDWTNKRINNAKQLSLGLEGIKGIVVPKVSEGVKHVFHQYTIKVLEDFRLTRDELIEKLKEQGVGCAVFYPKPLHLHPHFAKLGYHEGDFPFSEKFSKQVLSLPVHQGVLTEDIQKIISVIKGDFK